VNLILKGRGVELNDRLKDYATEKLTRAQRFFDRIIKMEVELSHERNPRVKESHRVEVTVKTPGETLRAHGGGGDYFSAIDQAADRLEAQVRKFKERRTNRRGPGSAGLAEANLEGVPTDAATIDGESGPVIVRTPPPLVKPMTPDEAVFELEERHLQFLLFTNAETMGAGVLYRRPDGTYGLIEHEG
jgi:ribosomal subunit interface protein